ncbi:MAG: hypothetical protein ACLSDQ_01715 [Adlercreutzia equolifaciens]
MFVLIPLAIAFLLGQLGCGECVEHRGQHHRHGADVSGGTWISLDLMPEAVRVVATFTPVYWLGEGLRAAVGDATGRRRKTSRLRSACSAVRGGHLRYGARGGRMRATSDDAGGNAAAAVPR